jgi:hypothetical protein
MNRHFWPLLGLGVLIALPVVAQRDGSRGGAPQGHGGAPHGEAPRANGGHIPSQPAKRDVHAAPEEEHRAGHVNNTPHVANNHWYGHDRPDDPRFHLDHPFPHGHFAHIGPSYRYNVVRIDAGLHRFWLPGGFFFEVAAWDWDICSDWCWNCGSDFVVYDDADHPGWYLVYNVQTGAYVHAQYMGS